jgi:glycosyltransferase involved in cell wall biosynthesis
MKKQKKPLVSVIMPVHNAGVFLGPAIESILTQTYDAIELIIVDDASTDDSWKTIRSYRKRYTKQIRAYRVKKKTNSAGNGATNYGLTKAKGQFIARMDADDISYPTRIEKQVAYMMAHPATILCGTQAKIIDKHNKVIGVKHMPTTHEAIYEQFGVLHPLIHPSVMIRRSLLPYPDKIYAMKWDVNDDYYTFFRLLNYGAFANLPEYLLKYRIHGTNLSLINPKEKFMNSIKIRLEAMRQGYRMSAKSMVLMMAQFSVLSLIPSQLIVPAYMYMRGMNQTPKKMIMSWFKKHPLSMRIVTFAKKYYTYT